MPDFTDPFRYYLVPDDQAIKDGMTTGMIVLDTNVLLSAYRFAPTARGELLSVVERIAERVWIPHRVAEEFHRNRLSVISDYDAAYVPVIEALNKARESLTGELAPKISQLANRAALADSDRDKLLERVTASTGEVISMVEGLRGGHGLNDLRGTDEILAKFQNLFQGKTGSALDGTDHEAAIAEAKRRGDNNIPPGYVDYRDAKKPEPFGDYLVWKQTLLEVERRSANLIIFVTGDTKEDWYQIIKGKTVGARPELVKEMLEGPGAQLIIMNTKSLLYHAREYLNAEVSQETIRQADQLPRAASDQSLQHARRQKKRSDVIKLSGRINSRLILISALEKTIKKRLAENPEDEPAEVEAMRRQLEDSRNSVRILLRRLRRLVEDGEDFEIDESILKELIGVSIEAAGNDDPDGQELLSDDLENLAITDLQKIAQQLGIQRAGRMRKSDLIREIRYLDPE